MTKFSPKILALCAVFPIQAALAFGLAPAMAAPAGDPDPVVITIGEHKITASQFNEIVKRLPPEAQGLARGPQRRDFAMNLAELQMLADQAVKTGLDKKPDLKMQIEFQRMNLLAQAMFQNLQENTAVSDAEVQAYYDAHKADYETVTARHILIRAKGSPMPAGPGKPELSDADALAKAQALRKRILGGEDFAKLAKQESDDTGSGANGGDLGTFKKGMMVAPFEAAAFTLKPGDTSQPVKTEFGYHIIQVQAHTTKSLAEAKPEILAQLKPAAARQAVVAMTGKAKVKISDTFFGPAPASK
jgi:parvulin-like peptidyl-prolyl isomerase